MILVLIAFFIHERFGLMLEFWKLFNAVLNFRRPTTQFLISEPQIPSVDKFYEVQSPTKQLSISEPRNPLINVSGQHRFRRHRIQSTIILIVYVRLEKVDLQSMRL